MRGIMMVEPSFPTRRVFLAQTSGVVLSGTMLQASDTVRTDADRVAILNDTHVGGIHPDHASIPTRLRETVAWLAGLERLPAAVVINGDLALSNGQRKDYEHLARLLAPLRAAGVPVHFTLGNHDDRAAFREVLAQDSGEKSPVPGKHVKIVSLTHANLFLLDSLHKPPGMEGRLGADQLEWLASMLRTTSDKPALIFAHHNPRLGGDPSSFARGLEDSHELWQVLKAHRQVKAYVHGHLHHRSFAIQDGIHILNTPATGFVTRPETSTTGWTMAQLTGTGCELTTFTHTQDHPWNRAEQVLSWRA